MLVFTEKDFKWTIKVENGWKKKFWPAFGCAQHPKAGLNTQHPAGGQLGLRDPQVNSLPIELSCMDFVFILYLVIVCNE